MYSSRMRTVRQSSCLLGGVSTTPLEQPPPQSRHSSEQALPPSRHPQSRPPWEQAPYQTRFPSPGPGTPLGAGTPPAWHAGIPPSPPRDLLQGMLAYHLQGMLAYHHPPPSPVDRHTPVKI